MHISNASRLAGTTLVCFSLLTYEILTTRLLSVVLESHLIVFAIALAMLGMGAATSFASLGRSEAKPPVSPISLSWAATALGASYLISLGLLTVVSDNANIATERAMDAGGLSALVDSIRATMVGKMALVGAILFVPYFIFGLLIARLFTSATPAECHTLYAADLIGAAFGCVLAVVSLDSFGYPGCLALILTSTSLGAAAFSEARSKPALVTNLALAAVVMFAAASPSTVAYLEPRPSLDQLARNYDKTNEVTEDWHEWSALSRVALLSMRDKRSGDIHQVYAHEDGTGWAHVPDRSFIPNPWSRLATLFNPKKVLVLFAGVGADMMDIDRLCGGTCEITGVEINRHMVEHALAHASPELKSLLSKPGISLEIAEAREFLERDPERYDVVLLSWWGAGASHYVGTSGRLAQYLYTREAYDSLLDHLTPEGVLILFNSSKAQSLVNLREVFAERGLGSLADRAVILKDPSEDRVSGRFQFYDTLEAMRLVVKPSGFNESEMNTVQALAEELQARIVLSPDGVDPEYTVYGRIADGADLDAINRELIADHGTELSIVTDDRPFINELVPRSYYLDIDKWFGSGEGHGAWSITKKFLQSILALSVVAIIFIVGPLVSRSGPGLSRQNITELFYFLALGCGFILIEVGLVRQLGLLLGHPSYSISIVLAALVLSTGLGSLSSNWLFQSGRLTVKRTALFIVAYVILGSVLHGAVVDDIISMPLVSKCVIVAVFLFPLGFLMGQLFPQGLARVSARDYRLVPWAWAINATASTISVGVAYLLSYPVGFNALLGVGAAFYAVVVFLPLPRARQTRVELAAPSLA